MYILHGSWLMEPKQFAVWGEDTGIEPQVRKGRRGRVFPHPFQLSIRHLLDLVIRHTTDAHPNGKTILVWLPGYQKNVQASPEAITAGMAAPPSEELELLGWEVDCILLTPLDFLDLMLQLPAEPRSFALANDLQYWRQVALLSMNLLVEGRYLPALEQRGTQLLARWSALLDPTLREQLLVNMPPLCRTLVDDLDHAPPPATLLDHGLNTLLDTFIRQCYAETKKKRVDHPWVLALIGRNQTLSDNPHFRKLYQEWQQWQAIEGGAGGFRVCYRLEEPAPENQDWHLTYFLQATDDPSLLVEAKTVWDTRSDHLEYLEHRFHKPQEKLLESLGRASRIYPPIERSLRHAQPTGVTLSSEEAYQFLIEAAAPLEASGYSVLIPNWWHGRNRLKVKAKIKGQANEPTGFLNRDSLVNYRWELSVGDSTLSQAEFEQLVALKQPLLQYRGEWIMLDPDHVKAVSKFFEQAPTGEMTVMDALKMAASDEPPTASEIDRAGVEIEGWLEDLLTQIQKAEAAISLTPAAGLKAQLRPYQERGLGWLVQMAQMRMGACLADDMGLGKTLQTIAYWQHHYERGQMPHPALLICPTSVVGNWAHEIARFAPSLRYLKHQGADRLQGKALIQAAGEVQVVITSYALLHRDLETLQQIEWSSVVLDEAQNIKNPSTKQAQAARSIPAETRIALTGTPVENRLTELWSIMEFLNRGYLGSQKAFKASFSIPVERYKDQAAAATLRKMTAPFILRRLKTDPTIIQDLPEKFENKVYCSLSPEQATLYEAAVREEMEAIETAEDDMQRRGNVLRMLTRLKQICNHPAHFLKEGERPPMENRSGKLTRLTEMLEEIQELQEKTLIFTQYAEMGTLLQHYLRDYLTDEVLFLHGGTPAPKREEMVRLFQMESGPPIFILSLKAGGTGLNLTRANHVFHYDRWYNPAVENQATDRAFRIGQTKNVQVHKFICLGTLEEHIDELIEHKKALADQIVGEGESWLSEMSNADLRELVTLRREVMEE